LTEEELAAREAELVRMFVAFADRPDADRLRVYLEELEGLPFAVFQAAVRSALGNQKKEFAPSVGRIKECAQQPLLEYRARQEELELQRQIASGEIVPLRQLKG
jgi:hypothetical protein